MQILIDATPLLLRSAGVKNYTYYWIQNLWQQARNDRILTLPALASLGPLNHERSIAGSARTYMHLGRVFAANAVPSLPLLRWTMPKADVFHVSNQIRYPPKGVKLTATIYDMTVRLMPELHTAANIQADESLAKNVLARADRLIAISENSRQDAARLLGLDADRIEVIYPGVPEVYFGAQARPSEQPYVLYLRDHRAAQERGHAAGCVERFSFSRRFRSGNRGRQWMGGRENTGASGVAAARSTLSRICAGRRTAGVDGGRQRVRLSIFIRRLWISGGAGHGGGRSGDHFEYVVPAGGGGRGRAAGGSSKRRRKFKRRWRSC